jgi:hypothetical protein
LTGAGAFLAGAAAIFFGGATVFFLAGAGAFLAGAVAFFLTRATLFFLGAVDGAAIILGVAAIFFVVLVLVAGALFNSVKGPSSKPFFAALRELRRTGLSIESFFTIVAFVACCFLSAMTLLECWLMLDFCFCVSFLQLLFCDVSIFIPFFMQRPYKVPSHI